MDSMEPNIDQQPDLNQTQAYTEEDFALEQEEMLETCDDLHREMYEEDYLGRLNNFPAFFPVRESPYRRTMKTMADSANPEILRIGEVCTAIDKYLEEQGISVAGMTAKEVKEKMPQTIVDLYISLRNQGFSREELTK